MIGKRPDVNDEALHIDVLDITWRLLLRPDPGASDCGGDSGCGDKRPATCDHAVTRRTAQAKRLSALVKLDEIV